MRALSLRAWILGTVLTTILIAFAAFSVYLDRAERGNRIADVDTELVRAERATIVNPPRVDPPAPGGVDDVESVGAPVQLLVSADGTVLAGSGAVDPFDSDVLAELVVEEGNHTTSDPRYRVRVTAMGDGRVAVTALPLDDFDTAVRRFRAALAAGGVVIIVLVAGVLWILAGFLSRPVARMTKAAGRIAAGDLDTPVGTPGGPRETLELATDLDHMVAQLRSAVARSDEARQTTERLLADLAHEIRTPLTALKGYSDLYAGGMLETVEDVDRAMARVGSESQRLNELANSMLQVARHGAQPVRAELVDIDELVGDVVSDLRAAYPDQAIGYSPARSVTPLIVSGSPEGLHQALLNIGSNACQHSPADTTIEILLSPRIDVAAISIADHGPGVDPNQRERIFEPFYRTDTARHRDADHGAGLGLALARRIAEQHGGTITIEPTPGGGATFTFAVPASPTQVVERSG